MSKKFTGRVVAEWLANKGPDRNMRLIENFSFTDSDGLDWTAPKGAVVNGASIPRIAWTWGPPFVGDYRRASVVHDYYCTKGMRTRTWQSTHLMFQEACVEGGVDRTLAKLMYLVVRNFGPRWPDPSAKSSTGYIPDRLDDDAFYDVYDWILNEGPSTLEIDEKMRELELDQVKVETS